MKQNWKVIGLTVLVAGALAYPAYKLIQYLSSKKNSADEGGQEEDHHVVKAFIPAYRGRRHKHHDHN